MNLSVCVETCEQLQILWKYVLTGLFTIVVTAASMWEQNLQTSRVIISSCMCSHRCHGEQLGTGAPHLNSIGARFSLEKY